MELGPLLKDKRILLGVTGSVAAYKAATLTSRLAQAGALVDVVAQNSVARTVHPAHTMFDVDTLFALLTGDKRADVNLVSAYSAEVTA